MLKACAKRAKLLLSLFNKKICEVLVAVQFAVRGFRLLASEYMSTVQGDVLEPSLSSFRELAGFWSQTFEHHSVFLHREEASRSARDKKESEFGVQKTTGYLTSEVQM